MTSRSAGILTAYAPAGFLVVQQEYQMIFTSYLI
jgi:hypothetical protein